MNAKAQIWLKSASSPVSENLPTGTIYDNITNLPEWNQDPFHFRLYFDSFTSKERGKMAFLLMIDVDRDSIDKGLSFFQKLYDGKQRHSPNAIAYPFLPLYRNTYNEAERTNIIHDRDAHTDHISVITLLGL